MRWIRQLFDFYINASIHVALAVCALVYLSLGEYEITPPDALFGMVFFGTISGYNFIKYARIAGLHHRSLAGSLKTIQLFSMLSAVALLYFMYYLPHTLWWPLIFLGLVTLLYAVPFVYGKSLRTLYGIKIFVVGFVWAGVGVWLPLGDSHMLWAMDAWLSFAQLFLLVVVWTLPFEIRDITYDASHLGTLPQRLGITGAKVLGFVLLGIVVVAEGFKDEFSQVHFFGLLLMVLLSGLLLGLAQKKQPKYFASFLVESIPIVWVVFDFGLRRLLG